MVEFLFDVEEFPASAYPQLAQWEAGAFVDYQREREDAMRLAAGRDELSRSFGRFKELCGQEALSNIEFA